MGARLRTRQQPAAPLILLHPRLLWRRKQRPLQLALLVDARDGEAGGQPRVPPLDGRCRLPWRRALPGLGGGREVPVAGKPGGGA